MSNLMSDAESDAETVLGESPLSPCVWTQPAAVKLIGETDAGQQGQVASTRTDEEPAVPAPTTVPPPPSRSRELHLSPGSQLDVLSQISELASAQPRQSAVLPVASRSAGQLHMWAPAMRSARGKRSIDCNSRGADRSRSSVVQAKKPKTTKPTTGQKKKKQSQAEQLAADMLDWETCSEGDLFTGDADDDDWMYEDISDSDFEQ